MTMIVITALAVFVSISPLVVALVRQTMRAKRAVAALARVEAVIDAVPAALHAYHVKDVLAAPTAITILADLRARMALKDGAS